MGKRKDRLTEVTFDGETFVVETWWDYESHNWITQIKDEDGNQIGEAQFTYSQPDKIHDFVATVEYVKAVVYRVRGIEKVGPKVDPLFAETMNYSHGGMGPANERLAIETIQALDVAIKKVNELGLAGWGATGIDRYIEEASHDASQIARVARKIGDDYELDLTDVVGWK